MIYLTCFEMAMNSAQMELAVSRDRAAQYEGDGGVFP